jgi:hypothetical protein
MFWTEARLAIVFVGHKLQFSSNWHNNANGNYKVAVPCNLKLLILTLVEVDAATVSVAVASAVLVMQQGSLASPGASSTAQLGLEFQHVLAMGV